MESESLEMLNSHPEMKYVDGEKAGRCKTLVEEDRGNEVRDEPEEGAGMEDVLIPAGTR